MSDLVERNASRHTTRFVEHRESLFDEIKNNDFIGRVDVVIDAPIVNQTEAAADNLSWRPSFGLETS
jgi:hypothetical protein